jgi:hypothetical protein
MQLRNARLCLDCEEVHDAAHCPMCASESFAFITRWVPSPSGDGAQAGASAVPATRTPPRERPLQAPPVEPVARETLDTYRQLLSGRPAPSSNWRLVKRGALGLAIFGLAGLAWKQQNQRGGTSPRDDERKADGD